jgi:hypothetical protein
MQTRQKALGEIQSKSLLITVSSFQIAEYPKPEMRYHGKINSSGREKWF